jgi:hypothetical protein
MSATHHRHLNSGRAQATVGDNKHKIRDAVPGTNTGRADAWVTILSSWHPHFHRVGKLIYDNDEYYEGEWNRGKRHGRGIYVYMDGLKTNYSTNLISIFSGSKFDGTWENDRINGEGTSWYPNGNRYQGDWSNGRINGRGLHFCLVPIKWAKVLSIWRVATSTLATGRMASATVRGPISTGPIQLLSPIL